MFFRLGRPGPPLIVAAGLQPRGKAHGNPLKSQPLCDGQSDDRGFRRSPLGLGKAPRLPIPPSRGPRHNEG
ncbi:hypothetical protein SAMN02745206_03737 [Desulfacinum infernum DSM 9756]|uniref:Uncharacterized protein n=1 Tax=Desulfacinum infernum DSM 9756 TaxID=1121391 RepID=A0A1M5J6G5_9BACT|nr:hypothetical protein SAMN02745206_03737 [Desulfacinum infernum DSM 9756]